MRIHVPTARRAGLDLAVLGEVFASAREAMIPFADTCGGDLFVWDPARVTAAGEYGIYALPHGLRIPRVVAFRGTFADFVRRVCLDGKFLGRLVGSPVAVKLDFACL